MTDTGIVKTIRCEGCGRTLKPAALFCTACGTRRDIQPEPVRDDGPATDAVTSTAAACVSCGSSLRPGAEFCTECGAKASSDGPIDLTPAPPTDAPAPPAPADRVSPAASRAILGSVSGGMGSYVGKTSKSTTAPPPPVLPTGAGPDGEHHRRNVAIIAVAAAVLLLIGGIAVLVATQRSNDGSLKAGQGSRRSADGTFTTGPSGDASSDSTSSSTGSSKSSGSKTDSTKSTSGSTSASSTPGSKTSSTSRSTPGSKTSSPSKGTTSGSKATSPTRHPSAPPKTTTRQAPAVPPAKMVLSTSAISVSDAGGSVTIRNSGGKSMYWSISSAAIDNGALHFTSNGGTLGGGASATVGVSWSGGAEGTGSGSFDVNGAGGTRSVSVSGDNRQGDWVDNVRQAGCGTSCAPNSLVYIQTIVRARNGATPSLPQQICFQVQATNKGTQCWQYADWGGVLKPGNVAQVRVPVRNNNFTSGSTQMIVWVVDRAGIESEHRTLTILN